MPVDRYLDRQTFVAASAADGFACLGQIEQVVDLGLLGGQELHADPGPDLLEVAAWPAPDYPARDDQRGLATAQVDFDRGWRTLVGLSPGGTEDASVRQGGIVTGEELLPAPKDQLNGSDFAPALRRLILKECQAFCSSPIKEVYLRIQDFNYELPAGCVATHPMADRTAAKLLVLDIPTNARRHASFCDLPGLLRARSLVVLNDTRVIPARLTGKKPTGGRAELLLVRRVERQNTPHLSHSTESWEEMWEVLLRGVGSGSVGRILLEDDAEAEIVEKGARGSALALIRGTGPGGVLGLCERFGTVPLPPYIEAARKRTPGDADRWAGEADRQRYQTVYARVPGAVAAPTAGLHFTEPLLAELGRSGHEIARVTLHVGPGTFRPVETDDPRDHRLDPEWFEVPDPTATAIARARRGRPSGGRGRHHRGADPGDPGAAGRNGEKGRRGRWRIRRDRSFPAPRKPFSDSHRSHHQLSPPPIHLAHAGGRLRRSRTGPGGLCRSDCCRLSFLQLRGCDAPPAGRSLPVSSFRLEARDGPARAGVLETAHGPIRTPVFMPVGTQATVKALSVPDLRALGVEVLLGNTYHLALRPGAGLIERVGGLHRFMAWPGAILTDSGGYQVFSLAARRQVDEDGVTFRSHLDGSEQRLTPERAMSVQASLGSDIAMAFDECPPSDAPPELVAEATHRTTRWARRCLLAPRAPGQLRFGIVQGGIDLGLRRAHLAEIAAMPFEGLALGGLGVGEPPAVMHELVSALAPEMPAERPRYLMGVGRPEDLLRGIAAGIDMFDCVMPTRNARNGQLFVRSGRINIGNSVHREADMPIEAGCPCETCRCHSRAYLAHLYHAKEILYARLATLHNLQHYLDLVRGAREAICAGRLETYVQERLSSLERGINADEAPPEHRGCGRFEGPELVVTGEAASDSQERMGKRVVVLLSGCGAGDGSDIHESLLTLIALERSGAEAICAAPAIVQARVFDHLHNQDLAGESPRQALLESARLARGKIREIGALASRGLRRHHCSGRRGRGRCSVQLRPERRAL